MAGGAIRPDHAAAWSNPAQRRGRGGGWRLLLIRAPAHGKEGSIDVAIIREELRVACRKVAGPEGRDRAAVASDPRACDVDRNHRCEAQEDEQVSLVF